MEVRSTTFGVRHSSIAFCRHTGRAALVVIGTAHSGAGYRGAFGIGTIFSRIAFSGPDTGTADRPVIVQCADSLPVQLQLAKCEHLIHGKEVI